jgi:N-terminal domain of toast_rack, DUF2154
MAIRCAILLLPLMLAGCAGRAVAPGPVQHQTQAIELDKTEMARVEIRMGAGEVKVEGGSPRLLDAEFTYDNPALKPLVHYQPSSFRGLLQIEQPNVHSAGPTSEYAWNLRLNDGLPLDVVTNLGAGDADLNLGSLNLRSVQVHMGVGNLDMNLRGHPRHDYDVEIHGGVGNATVRLPANVGVVADAQGGIGDIEARGLEKHGGRWVSLNHDDAKLQIHLAIRGGVGNITLVAD